MARAHIVIISPATAKANNGNWQTASRWARFLESRYRVSLLEQWDGRDCDALIALHARRSAASIEAFAAARPARPLALVLTGTDLYRDIKTDAAAQRSLQLATRLVVLQDAGLQELPASLRAKACVIYQSAPPLAHDHSAAYTEPAEVVMLGHLRDEKDPLTFMRAAQLVTSPQVRMTHIGAALDPLLGDQASATQRATGRYRWLGNLPHTEARKHLANSRLMAICSKIEGGANVIIESVTSGVPVLASDIPGNRGMLGKDYAGYFPVGDSLALARAIDRAIDDPAFYALLKTQCNVRAPLFSPQREQAAVLQLMDNLQPPNE